MEENKEIENKNEIQEEKIVKVNLLDYIEKHSKQIEELNKKFLEIELSKQKDKKEKKELEL